MDPMVPAVLQRGDAGVRGLLGRKRGQGGLAKVLDLSIVSFSGLTLANLSRFSLDPA